MSKFENFASHAHLRDERTKTLGWDGGNEEDETGCVLKEFDDFITTFCEEKGVADDIECIWRCHERTEEGLRTMEGGWVDRREGRRRPFCHV
jgi:hypothetical protein